MKVSAGKHWFRPKSLLPNSRMLLGLYAVLLLIFTAFILANRDLATVWALMMVPIFLAALFYARPTYMLTLGMYTITSYTVIALESVHKLISYQETTAFIVAVAIAGEILFRLAQARTRAEGALRQSEERFRTLSATAPIGIFETDASSRTIYVNPQFLAIMGIEPGDECLKSLAGTIHHADREATFKDWLSALQAGKDYARETRIDRPDGQVIWVDCRATPTFTEDGKVKSYVGTIEDITERKRTAEALQRAKDELEERVKLRTDDLTRVVEKLEKEINERRQAEEALRRSEERFSKAFHVSASALGIMKLADSRFVDANDAFLQMVGYSMDGLVGYTADELGINLQGAEREIAVELMRTGGSVRDMESVFLTRLREPRLALISLEQIELDGEDCLLIMAMDITERKALEARLKDYAESLSLLLNQLMSAQEAERRRLAMDIHDGPLQSLGVSLLALDRAIRRLERQEYDVVERELRFLRATMASTVGEVRAVLADLSLEVLSTYGLVFALRGHLERFADITGITARMEDKLNRRLAPDVELMMYRLAQEALANVRKHAHAENVTVTLAEQDNRLHMSICDDGRGFKVGAALQQRQDGDKIGLRSMLQRVKAMGGDLSITSAPGEGTCLDFWCPLAEKSQAALEVVAESAAR